MLKHIRVISCLKTVRAVQVPSMAISEALEHIACCAFDSLMFV